MIIFLVDEDMHGTTYVFHFRNIVNTHGKSSNVFRSRSFPISNIPPNKLTPYSSGNSFYPCRTDIMIFIVPVYWKISYTYCPIKIILLMLTARKYIVQTLECSYTCSYYHKRQMFLRFIDAGILACMIIKEDKKSAWNSNTLQDCAKKTCNYLQLL